jgi:hypothetical protein
MHKSSILLCLHLSEIGICGSAVFDHINVLQQAIVDNATPEPRRLWCAAGSNAAMITS